MSEHERSLQARYEMAVKRIVNLTDALARLEMAASRYMDTGRGDLDGVLDHARFVLDLPTNPTQEDE